MLRWTLDPQTTFLNHGSFGACPEPVLAAQAELRAEMEREPVRFFRKVYPQRLEGSRARLAEVVGADAEDLVFVPNATAGVNAVLSSAPLGPGDRVLTTDHAYAACRKALSLIAARRGFAVDVATIPFPLTGPDDVVRPILEAVRPKTRLALIDHVTSPTAVVFPIARIVAALRARGVETLVDGAHSAGQVPLDLERLGAAYFTGNAHKWLCTPKGVAFLVVRRDRQGPIVPTVLSHFVDAPSAERFRLSFDWTGTFDPTGLLSLPAALDALEGAFDGGLSGLMAANHAGVVAGRSTLLETLKVGAPAPAALLGAMAAVPLPDAPDPGTGGVFAPDLPTRLEQRLEARRIQVPIVCWPGPPRRWVRISHQAYNQPAQYAHLASVLAEARAEGL